MSVLACVEKNLDVCCAGCSLARNVVWNWSKVASEASEEEIVNGGIRLSIYN